VVIELQRKIFDFLGAELVAHRRGGNDRTDDGSCRRTGHSLSAVASSINATTAPTSPMPLTPPPDSTKSAGFGSATAPTLHGVERPDQPGVVDLLQAHLHRARSERAVGFSLLTVFWLMNTRTTAESECSSDTAARTTAAVVLTDFCLAAGVTIC